MTPLAALYRWPSKSFWWMKTTFFVIFLLVLFVTGLVFHFSQGMRAFGPVGSSAPLTPAEYVVGWLVTTPMRPSDSFPTSAMSINFLTALGVNAVVWSWLGSLAMATVVHVLRFLIRRGFQASPGPDQKTLNSR